METENDKDDPLFLEQEWTAEELSAEFQDMLADLGWTPVELADRMQSLGDYRPYKTILRGIHRAMEGQIKISGEMMALMRQAVRYNRRLKRAYEELSWTKLGDGSWTTKAEDFTITLVKKSKGRWLVNLVHESGYSPSWPRWQDNLEAAKEMAFLTLDNGVNWLLEYDQQEARNASRAAASTR